MLFAFPAKPDTAHLMNDPWIGVSAMQKSIRRGDTANALTAIAFLLDGHADRFWRRLPIIAMEDIGIGDLATVRDVLVTSTRRSWRQRAGEWALASELVLRLCAARKSRDTEHLLIIADHSPVLAGSRSAFLDLSPRELCDILSDDNRPPPERALAAWLTAGTKRFPTWFLPEKAGSFGDLIDCYRHLGVPEDVLEIARLGSVRTQEGHPLALPLVWLTAAASPSIAVEETIFDPAPMIRGWPSFAFDMHTRAGKRAIDLFSRRCLPLRALADRYLPTEEIAEFFGTAIFRAEGPPR